MSSFLLFREGDVYLACDALHNGILHSQIYLWELADADWMLTPEGLRKKPSSLRTAEQDLILSTPEKFHVLLEPFYRTGHMMKFGYLKLRELMKRYSPF